MGSRLTWPDAEDIIANSRSCIICYRELANISVLLQVGRGRVFDATWDPTEDAEFCEKFKDAANRYADTHRIRCRISTLRGDKFELYWPTGTGHPRIHGQKQLLSITFRLNNTKSWRIKRPNEGIEMQGDTVRLSSSRVSLLRSWIDRCAGKHHECRQTENDLALAKAESLNPARLIELTADDGRIRLIETDSQRDYRYAALSHCWGGLIFTTLKEDNYDSFMQDIDPLLLTRTFREAIILCRQLAIGYIWIDSLCIRQDSAEDFKSEIVRMGKIYSNAFLNIAATASANGNGGLFRPINWLSAQQAHFGTDQYLEIRAPIHGTAARNSPLLSRGWVVQELALSRRTIHFTDTTIVFVCRSDIKFEGKPHDDGTIDDRHPHEEKEDLESLIDQKLNLKTLDMEFALHLVWRNVARTFVRTHVTYSDDRVNAIAALVVEFGKQYQGIGITTECIAGCWLDKVFIWLSWYSSNHGAVGGSEALGAPRSAPGIPAWSWLSAAPAADLTFMANELGDTRMLRYSNKLRLVRSLIRYRIPGFASGPLESGYLLVESAWFKGETHHFESSGWIVRPSSVHAPAAPTEKDGNSGGYRSVECYWDAGTDPLALTEAEADLFSIVCFASEEKTGNRQAVSSIAVTIHALICTVEPDVNPDGNPGGALCVRRRGLAVIKLEPVKRLPIPTLPAYCLPKRQFWLV